MNEVITYTPFGDIDLEDVFFKTLKEDYPEFVNWYKGKAQKGELAYIQRDETGKLHAFLYMKDESGKTLDDITPSLPACKRLKVGTFKIDAHGTKLGERFVKKILDTVIVNSYEEVYLTIYPKHVQLIDLIKKYGFEKCARKGEEDVYIKSMRTLKNDILLDYPLINVDGKRKFLLAIYPKYHTRLFPDSILKNEEGQKYELIKDISPTNSIHKIYLCFMPDTAMLQRGDLILIYRTNDGLGPAYFRSVITSVCQVEEVKTNTQFQSCKEFIDYTNKYSIFDEAELRKWYNTRNVIVIKMTYNIAFSRKVTRSYLLNDLNMSSSQYWGFLRLTDKQFDAIIQKGEINENIIIH